MVTTWFAVALLLGVKLTVVQDSKTTIGLKVGGGGGKAITLLVTVVLRFGIPSTPHFTH